MAFPGSAARAAASVAPVPPGARRHRLTGRGSFEAIFETGRRQDGRYVQLVYVPAARAPGRVGYVVGRKALPLAVDRNRVKRMFRAAVADARPAVERYDVIVRLKRPCARGEFKAVRADAVRLLALLPSLVPPEAS